LTVFTGLGYPGVVDKSSTSSSPRENLGKPKALLQAVSGGVDSRQDIRECLTYGRFLLEWEQREKIPTKRSDDDGRDQPAAAYRRAEF
jgi:hypothetical protein